MYLANSNELSCTFAIFDVPMNIRFEELRFCFFIIIPIINVIWWIPKLHFLMTLKGYASKCNAGTLFCALNDHFFPTLKYSDLHNGFSYVSCQIYASSSSSMLFNNVYILNSCTLNMKDDVWVTFAFMRYELIQTRMVSIIRFSSHLLIFHLRILA